jgi:hypothetical protein
MYNFQHYSPALDIDKFKGNHHSMVLFDNETYGNLVKYHFIEDGLKKNERSICLTHGSVDKVENEMVSLGIDLDHYKAKKLLHIYQLENILENKGGINEGFGELLTTVTRDSKPPQRFMGRCVKDVSTIEGIKSELVIEHLFHSHFDKYNCSFLCTYGINEIEGTNRPTWLNELFKNHHHLIYATDPAQAVTFDPDLIANFVSD